MLGNRVLRAAGLPLLVLLLTECSASDSGAPAPPLLPRLAAPTWGGDPPPRKVLDAWHVTQDERRRLDSLVSVRVEALRAAARVGPLPVRLELPLPAGVASVSLRASLGTEVAGCSAALDVRRGPHSAHRSLSAGKWVHVQLDAPGVAPGPLAIEMQADGCPAWVALSEIQLFPLEPAAPARPDLLLVVLDTVRRDHFDCADATAELMPELFAAWCQHGLFLEDAFSTSSWTYPAVASMLTGLRPSEHGGGRHRPQQLDLLRGVTTLAEILRWGGYTTAAVNPNWQAGRGLWRGFDSFFERHSGTPRRNGPEDDAGLRRGQGVVDTAIAWLDATTQRPSGRPIFLFLLFLDAHEPVNAGPLAGRVPGSCAGIDPLPTRWQGIAGTPPSGRRPGEPRNLPCRRDLYREALRYLDQQLGRLARHLEESGRASSTGLIVVSDHGEEFWDHAVAEAASGLRGPRGYGHGHTLYGELVRVPLLVVPPGGLPAPARSGRLASVQDTFATLLAMAGLHPPTDSASSDLLTEEPRTGHDRVISEATLYGPQRFSLSTRELRVIASEGAETLVFDRNADPLESSPLPPTAPLARRGAELLEEARGAREPRAAPGAADRAALRALGYAE